ATVPRQERGRDIPQKLFPAARMFLAVSSLVALATGDFFCRGMTGLCRPARDERKSRAFFTKRQTVWFEMRDISN
ncbi:hypothetical protein QUW15_07245, partial [Desulfovibrio piger]|nr:hypothetical protein [Desulfovibrio piger]